MRYAGVFVAAIPGGFTVMLVLLLLAVTVVVAGAVAMWRVLR